MLKITWDNNLKKWKRHREKVRNHQNQSDWKRCVKHRPNMIVKKIKEKMGQLIDEMGWEEKISSTNNKEEKFIFNFFYKEVYLDQFNEVERQQKTSM